MPSAARRKGLSDHKGCLGVRLCALLAAAVLLNVCCPAASLAEADHVVVGNPTPMRGEFFTELWGDATSDIDVRQLLHGYDLIMWDEAEARWTVDPTVVVEWSWEENKAGDHVFTFILSDELTWSDGKQITAWDYAFSYLFCLSPVLEEIGARPLRIEPLAGYAEYIDEGAPLSGVRVPSDDTLVLTLNHEYLPFFYEMGLLRCNPYPISVIAPGVEVRDDGEGVFLSNIEDPDGEPLFTAELLSRTVLDPETGYMSHPSVVSGPYMLTSWDGVTAEFAVNPFYKGNAEGEYPSISRLTYTLAENDTMIDKLADGEFGLLNKVTRMDPIMDGLERMYEAGFSMTDYPRTGLFFLSFACERPTVASEAVRKAIAWCMDRDQLTEDYSGDFGVCVDGWYGIGQWMYRIAVGEITPPKGCEGIDISSLVHYVPNPDMAASLLEQDGWRLNADGLREKNGVVLDLRLLYPEGNNIVESLQPCMADILEKAGIRVTMEAVPMADLLSKWYQQEDREADMFCLGSNFYPVYEPSVHFMPDGSWAYTNLIDKKLYDAAVAMRTTRPGDVAEYMKNWFAFQKRFNDILPMIPIYGNYYVDFYRSDLVNYRIEENMTWSDAIVGAWLGEE